MATSTPARRSFLMALLAAPVVAAAPAIAAQAPVITEAPELLALTERLKSIRERLTAATARKADASAIYERMKPALPDELRYGFRRDEPRNVAALEMGVDHQPIRGPEGYGPVYVYRWRLVQAHIITEDVSRHSKEGKRLRRIVRLAKAYEAGTAAALKGSKIHEAMCDLHSISVDICEVARALELLRPTTMAGAMVYVTAASLAAETRRQTEPSHAGGIADLAVTAVAQVQGEARNG